MSTLTSITPSLSPAIIRLAEEAHLSPPRAYHHFGHVRALLRHLEEVAAGPGLSDPLSVTLAALFHDAIYLAGRSDNEPQSAELACTVLTRHLPTADLPRIKHLILLTGQHGTLRRADLLADADAMHFLDADMAIIGASAPEFDAYDLAIAEEYRSVAPGPVYRMQRRKFLQRLLNSERIYHSDFFHDRLDAQARGNLRRALAHY